jgi:ATP-dependent DNA helicase RecG
MVLYGDLEVSFLDELPPGRTPIRTKVFRDKDRAAMYRVALEQLRRGYQAFIVYPLVEASEQLQQIRRAEERDQTMRAFRDGALHVLVATTVIEVGIDIPNATLMIVEHAERFGLSQLHQLRGRVGRGQAPGYCLLVNHIQSVDAAQRLRVMERQADGFKIAEADLALRGAGELLGTRQSGLADFRIANLARDSRLLIEARREAMDWLAKDPELSTPESARMRAILQQRWGQKLQLGAVG